MSELPKGWVHQKLVEITTKIGSGSTPRGGQEAYKTEGIPLVRSMNVRFSGIATKGLAFIDDKQAAKLSAVTINDRDVLLNITGASIGRVSVARDWAIGGRVNQHVCIIRPVFPDPLSGYLNYYLMTPVMQDYINSNESGATRQALTKAKVESLSIPLAPLAEQKRIVEKLDEVLAQVDTIKARLDGIPDLLKRFRQSVLASAVSGKLTEEWRRDNEYDEEGYPTSWLRKGLDDLGELARGKSKHRPRNDPRLFGAEYPFIQTGEVAQSNGVITSCSKWYSEFGLEQGKLFPKGTLCITIAANIADTAILGIDACFPDSVVGFTPKSDMTSALFVKYLIDVNKNRLEQFAPATAQKNINLKVLKSLSLPYPNLDEQDEIVRLVEQYFTFADTIEAQVKKAQARVDNLTQSILAKAFRGELVAQDPSDGPADKLLERIAEARKKAEALAKAAKKAEAAKKKAEKAAAKS
ncbi:restriction endonuclease subunit S [Vibrio sp. 10N.261.49.A5]|uniref:Type I restriction modification DNA specificity domain-containing protein n=1 Tax=Vibrio tasmaniensis 1F-267 TaxID=1191324 RepID=A0ABX3B605_9VIBR|nr:restriction endonuclease subunit S [Vibrio tasmaniensis]OEF48362.1 hypothetical protein A163_21280 [Vibrio tasmaniensis 1F-267]